MINKKAVTGLFMVTLLVLLVVITGSVFAYAEEIKNLSSSQAPNVAILYEKPNRPYTVIDKLNVSQYSGDTIILFIVPLNKRDDATMKEETINAVIAKGGDAAIITMKNDEGWYGDIIRYTNP